MLDDLWSFNFLTLSWSKIVCTGQHPKARQGHSVAVIDGIAYVLGGKNPDDGFLPGFMALSLSSKSRFQRSLTEFFNITGQLENGILWNT